MLPLQSFPRETLANITTIFTDVDDTLTIHGRITSRLLSAMEALQAKGVNVIPVTGRPAGWAHGLPRAWPIGGIIAENGAVAYWMENGKQRAMFEEPNDVKREAEFAALLAIQKEALAKFPMFNAAQDQFMRTADIAFDHAENTHPAVPKAQIAELVAFLESKALNTAVSSIHAHGCYAERSKLTMTKRFMDIALRSSFAAMNGSSIFIGDSHNDAQMFEHFKHTVGVANVVRDLPVQPKYTTQACEGDGFIELADAILETRLDR